MPKWTEAQAKAIYEPSGEGNILVSAAAGSGKTAVLVERIGEMVTRCENPISIDNLLVVTFTEAAAAEMKERIINRIGEARREASERGDSDRARRLMEQIHLTSSADINTIDAFCLGVVKNNFHILGIDPNFSIMDKSESDMLTDDTLTELFDSLYSSGDAAERERFARLVRVYSSNRDDEGLKNIIRKIYVFTQSFAEPDKWLREKADMYGDDMTESRWAKEIMLTEKKNHIVKRNRTVWRSMMQRMIKRVETKYGQTFDLDNPSRIKEAEEYWGKLWLNVCKCAEAANALEKAESWNELYGFYKTYIEKKSYLGTAINKLPAKIEAPEAAWRMYYGRYDDMRNFFREECMKLPVMEKDEFNKYVHSTEIKRDIDDIVWLTELFARRFEEKKTKRNAKTFSDIERLAYRLFLENENIRGEYAAKYEEVLIDEYQDTNGLQDAIFTLISRDNKNMFYVGDLKQSIYRFRGGDPTIFKKKSRRTARKNLDGTRVILSQNFRSRMQVIESINAVFKNVMSDDVGDVDYDKNEALSRDEEREPYADGENLMSAANAEHGYESELYRVCVTDGGDGDAMSAVKAEAMFIADKIREIVDGRYKVYDKDGKYRDIEYRDIVILMRSVKSDGDIMRDALGSRGINAFVQKEEYFERREINLMLSLVSVINNHRQDIPLIAVMRSPIGGFTETELAMIKVHSQSGDFYGAVRAYSAGENASEGEMRLERKCCRFISDLDRWRGYVKRKSIASLIWTLYEETHIYDFMGALEGGEEAQANLKLLYERAKRYEMSGFRGIFNFIRYIERMEQRREDISGAKLINENHNVVRIMTIHKSKGLEFPVVFLARTTKKFAFTHSGEENRITLHKDLGIGLDYYNYEDMYHKKLIFSEYIKDANKREYLSEEMRLLYVAMTRAKEKLIVTAAHRYKDSDEVAESRAMLRAKYSDGSVPARDAENARSYADWIIPAVTADGNCWKSTDVEIDAEYFAVTCETAEEEFTVKGPEEIRAKVYEILDYNYMYPKSGAIPAKTSVTAIKNMEDAENIRDEEPVYMASKPAFMRGENLGARIGTAHHQVMAYINLDKMREIDADDYADFVAEEAARIAAEGQIEREIAEDSETMAQICENICGFFRSDMGSAVLKSEKVWREKPFEIEIPATDYDASLSAEYAAESVVVQGIIDLFFEDEDGDLVLVDYKTDRCKTAEEQQAVAKRYAGQLGFYERAMEKILKRKIKNKYLYLFSAQSVVKLN